MRRLLVNNPASGNHRSTTAACDIAREKGYQVWDTEEVGDAFALARRAAVEGVDVVVASGGDGTVNEVVRGVDRAGKLASTRLGVVPTGTGNGFAGDIGITGVRSAFDAIESGRVRSLDLGTADGHLFVKTCASGFLATVSARTTHEMKRFFGLAAYGLGAVSSAFDALQGRPADSLPELRARVGPENAPTWTGTAVMVLVGNSRRFPGLRYRQAPMEDGLLEVMIVKRPSVLRNRRRAESPATESDSPSLLRTRAADLEIEAPAPTLFSLDGEILERAGLTVGVRPRAVQWSVGEQYEY